MPLPQFFAARLLKQSIVDSVVTRVEEEVHILGLQDAVRLIRWHFWRVSWHYVVQISQRRLSNDYIDCR